jgi:hypothetical protein
MKRPSVGPEKCQFQSSTCGTYSLYPQLLVCDVLNKLNADVGKFFNADILITESDLISMRTNVPLRPDDLICPKHRFTLGKHWKPSPQCKYLEHPKNSLCKATTISWPLYKFVKSLDSTFILGSLICLMCQKKLNSKRHEELLNSDESDVNSDPNYVPPGPSINKNEKFRFLLNRVPPEINNSNTFLVVIV